MFKPIMLAICVAGAVVYASHDGYAQNCQTDQNCPCRDWAEVQHNLEWSITDNKTKKCVYVRIQSGSDNGRDAMKHCNPGAFTGPGVLGGRQSDLYNHCGAYVCNWLVAHKLTPACN